MVHERNPYPLKETPIERIFQKVVGRKMTSFEKVCFHLKRRIKAPPRDGAAVRGVAKAHRAKVA
jgi:hypothetical protein